MKMNRIIFAAIGLLVGVTTLAQAQKRIGKEFEDQLQGLKDNIIATKNTGRAAEEQANISRTQQFNQLNQTSLFSLGLAVAAAPRDRYVTKIEEARIDK